MSASREPAELVLETFEGPDGRPVMVKALARLDLTDDERNRQLIEQMQATAGGGRRLQAVRTTTWQAHPDQRGQSH